jgi:mRNA interferase MazF
MKRGDVYFADLDPTQGSEQRGTRPVLILQRDDISRYTRTIVIVPFTASQVDKYRLLPSCVFVPKGIGGLYEDSVALGHQVRTIDRARLSNYIGTLPDVWVPQIEKVVAFTLQMHLA